MPQVPPGEWYQVDLRTIISSTPDGPNKMGSVWGRVKAALNDNAQGATAAFYVEEFQTNMGLYA